MDHQNMERMIEFASKSELEVALCQHIAQDLRLSIELKGSATLLLSGGSTPSGVYRLLSEENLDWTKVHVGLVDERFVPADSPFSNFKLLQETLGQNAAKNVAIYPMVLTASDYDQNLKEIEVAYRIFTDPDICLLGMGPDGHTASIFPNDAASQNANINQSTLLSNTNAPSKPNLRITFNGPVLRRAKNLYLMITGAQKKAIFDDSDQQQLPIAAFKKALTHTFYTSAS
jgi:6-phosphogluconolactonase